MGYRGPCERGMTRVGLAPIFDDSPLSGSSVHLTQNRIVHYIVRAMDTKELRLQHPTRVQWYQPRSAWVVAGGYNENAGTKLRGAVQHALTVIPNVQRSHPQDRRHPSIKLEGVFVVVFGPRRKLPPPTVDTSKI